MILVIGEYPNKDNIKDGMVQRIKAIDNKIEKKERVYLEIKLTKNKDATEEKVNDKVKVYKLNYLLNRNLIKKNIKYADIIYIHSMINFVKIQRFSHLLKEKEVILDFHGVVPEEYFFQKKYLKGIVMNILERKAMKICNKIVYVTSNMKKYIEKKYKKIYRSESIIYPILPDEIYKISENKINENKISKLKKEFGITDQTVCIYSGNCQKWQNIDQIFTFIAEYKFNDMKFIILTGDIEGMKSNLKYDLIKEKIILRSVNPKELKYYYNIAHYGFILRDDHVLNKVACPTKLIEYMNYGIIPIVKSENIGDFKEAGYEFLNIYSIDNKLEAKKSEINKKIISDLINRTNINLF